MASLFFNAQIVISKPPTYQKKSKSTMRITYPTSASPYKDNILSDADAFLGSQATDEDIDKFLQTAGYAIMYTAQLNMDAISAYLPIGAGEHAPAPTEEELKSMISSDLNSPELETPPQEVKKPLSLRERLKRRKTDFGLTDDEGEPEEV
jgi:hypothetical protein